MEQCTETRICCHQPGCWRWNDGGLLRSEDSLCGRIDQNHIGAMQFFCTGGFLKLSLATKTFLASIKYISVSTFNSYSLCHITLLHSTQFMDSFFLYVYMVKMLSQYIHCKKCWPIQYFKENITLYICWITKLHCEYVGSLDFNLLGQNEIFPHLVLCRFSE